MKYLVAPLTLLFASLGTTELLTQRSSIRFARPLETTIADSALAGAAGGDFNGDGAVDLVVGLPDGRVHVALAGRRGQFGPPASYTVAPGRGHVAVADFNGDNALDIVFAGSGIAVLPGYGDGTFRPPLISAGSAAEAVVGDFDGDGRMDIASVGKNGQSTIPDSVDVYPGQGDGTFGPPRTVLVSDNEPRALAAGDLNGDGRTDLVLGLREIRQLVVYLNDGDLTFTPHASAFLEVVGPNRTTAADLDGDGDLDVLTANFVGSVSLFAGNGDGTLAPARTFPVCRGGACPAPQWAALADMDGDGALDVVTANQQPGSASVLLNDGAGAFSAAAVLDDVHDFAYAAVPGDFDGDGVADLAVTSGNAGFLDPGDRVVSTFVNRLRPIGPGNNRSGR